MKNKTIYNGDNYGTQSNISVENNYGTIYNNSDNEHNEKYDIIKNEVEYRDIIKNKIIECIISFILGGISFIPKILSETNIFNPPVNLCLLLVFIILLLLAIIILSCSLYNILLSTVLRKDGGFIEFKSVINIIKDLLASSSNNNNVTEYRSTGKIYKNIDNTIYELKGCKCPDCETGNIGHMYFVYNQFEKRYQLKCSENPDNHIKDFDYKKRI